MPNAAQQDQAIDVSLRILTIVVCETRWPRQETNALVVANSFGLYTCQASDLADGEMLLLAGFAAFIDRLLYLHVSVDTSFCQELYTFQPLEGQGFSHPICISPPA